ncbi:unnamed protein product, partial [Phaeothamnion confervicola]
MALHHVPQLLAVLYRRMRYPLDFSFDASDEDEGEEEMLRSQLRKAYVNIGRACPEATLQFLCAALQALPAPPGQLPWPDAEAALRLIHHYSEACAGATGGARLLKEGAFPQVVLALHGSDIASHPHPQVLMLYYELTVRYSKILRSSTRLAALAPVMDALCGPRGLLHPNRQLRTRCCYFLTKLTRQLGTEMRDYVDTAVPGIQALLAAHADFGLGEDACLNLYETMGVLIGMQGVEPAKQLRYLEGILGPQFAEVRRLLAILEAAARTGTGNGAGSGVGNGVGNGGGASSSAGDGGGGNAEAAGTALALSVAVIANVSKGFNKPQDTLTPIFAQVMEATGAAVLAMPQHEALRAKTLFLIHR